MRYFVYDPKGKLLVKSNSYRALTYRGVEINGQRAWRLPIVFGKPGDIDYHFLPVATVKHDPAVGFGEQDWVRVYDPESGYDQRLRRKWFSSFLGTLWFARQMNVGRAVEHLRYKCGCETRYQWGNKVYYTAIKKHWKEIRKFLKGKYGIDIDEAVQYQEKIRETAFDGSIGEQANRPDAALLSVCERANGRLLDVSLSLDKRQEETERSEELMTKFANAMREVKKEETTETTP